MSTAICRKWCLEKLSCEGLIHKCSNIVYDVPVFCFVLFLAAHVQWPSNVYCAQKWQDWLKIGSSNLVGYSLKVIVYRFTSLPGNTLLFKMYWQLQWTLSFKSTNHWISRFMRLVESILWKILTILSEALNRK